MSRSVLTVVAIFAIPLAVLPPVVGHMAEDAFMAQAESAPWADYLEVEVVEYIRGLYSSRATLRFGLDSAYVEQLRAAMEAGGSADGELTVEEMEAVQGNMTFRVVADLTHGPVGFNRGPFVGLAKGVLRPEVEGGVVERWRQRLDVPWLFEVRHSLRFGGSSRFDVVIPEIDYEGESGGLTLEGWDVWAEYDPETGDLSGEAGIEVIEAFGEGSNLRVESMRAEGEMTILGPSFAVGEGGFQVDRLSILQATGGVETADMVGLRATWATELDESGTAFETRFGYAVDSLLLDDRTLRDAELTLSARNVDREAADRWAEFSQDLWREAGEGNEEELAREVSGLMHDFLVAGPVLEVDPARFTYEGQSFRARLQVTVDPEALPAREEFEAWAEGGAAASWARIFVAEGEIDVARELAHTLAAESQEAALAAQLAQMGRTATDEEIEAMAREQAEAMLEMLVQAGYVAEEGDRYVARLGYDGGRLTANGQPLALPGG